MEVASVFIAGFAAVVLIAYFTVSRSHKERMELIKQGVNPINTKVSTIGTASLLWGLLLVAAGLALVIFVVVDGDTDPLGVGLMFLFGGLGLIIYYRITKAQRERAMRLQEELISAQAAQLKSEEKVES